MENKIDLNKFEHMQVGGKGCKDGMHRPNMEEGQIGIEKDGELTKLRFRCVACGMSYGISAPLGLNEYIGDTPDVQQEITNYPTHPTPMFNNTQEAPVDNGSNADLEILRAKLR